jgi:hypothetical protein
LDGKQDPQVLSEALNNVGWIGMTFGGQLYAGHGVAINGGSSKYVLIDFRLVRLLI